MRLAAALVLAIAACGSSPSPPPMTVPVTPERAEPPPPPPPPPKITFPGAPATPAGDQLAWVLDVLVHRHGQVATPEIEAHFSPEFIAKVPSAQLSAGFRQIGQGAAGLAITTVDGDATGLVAHVTAGGTARAVIELRTGALGRIEGLLFRADAPDPPKTYEDVDKQLAALAPHAQYLVAALDHGACKPLHASHSADELAIGSAFKLYVLLGLADRILAGKQAWTDELAVRDDWKSLPSGVTQSDPAGTKLSVQTLAERMISISDNTATDHLLYTVGRKAVEAAVRETKHAKPALDVPFLGTRELFIFKLGAPADAAAYIAAGEAARRKTLDVGLVGKAPDVAHTDAWKGARSIDKLEWFASSEDLCRAMGTLWTRAQNPKAAPVLDVLAKNPGLPIDKTNWPYVGFKGGSEPGVLELTFLLRRADQRWFVVTTAVNADEGGAVEESLLFPIALGLVELANKEP